MQVSMERKMVDGGMQMAVVVDVEVVDDEEMTSERNPT
jgi:hypothetical protein